MSDTREPSLGTVDPIAQGIEQGLARAQAVGLPRTEVREIAVKLVQEALDRHQAGPGRRITAPQAELFAEFVTLALCADVPPDVVSSWTTTLCGPWGK
jgi:hypothetical protein